MRSERNADRERLEREIRGEAYTSLLRQLQQADTFPRRFYTWADVVAFMRHAPAGDLGKDEVLRPILHAHQCDRDHRWRTVLLAVFWLGLESIHWRRRDWDRNPDQRWQNVVWAFLQAVSGTDATRRSCRLFEKLYAETARRLYREYARQWREKDREVPTDPTDLVALAGAADDADSEVHDLNSVREAVLKLLQAHLAAGRIDEADFLLLVGTRVYGKSVADYCRETGMSYQAARRRRARAEAVLRDHEKKLAEK